jgi:hypothetical protein
VNFSLRHSIIRNGEVVEVDEQRRGSDKGATRCQSVYANEEKSENEKPPKNVQTFAPWCFFVLMYSFKTEKKRKNEKSFF